MGKIQICVAVGALLTLGACGGGGSGPQPMPPTPPAPPSPPPPPPPAFPLENSESFSPFIAQREHRERNWEGPLLDRLAVNGPNSAISVNYDAGAGTYTITNGTASATFAASDRVSTSGYVDTYSKQSGAISDKLELFGNVRAGASQGGAPLKLTYVSFGLWTRIDSPRQSTQEVSGPYTVTALLFGYPTAATAMPKTGSGSYATFVMANSLEEYGTVIALDGTASISADFGAAQVSTSLSLIRPSDQLAFGTFTGTAPIDGNSFAGNFTSTNLAFNGGSFVGGFFGPAAEEVGYTFEIQRRNPDPFAGPSVEYARSRIIGTVVGVRQ